MAVSSAQKRAAPVVSRNTLELLIDLVEIKLGCVEVYDREDQRELRALERAKAELNALLAGRTAAAPGMAAYPAGRHGRPAHARAA